MVLRRISACLRRWWTEAEESALPADRPEQVAFVLREMLRRTEELSRRSESMSSRSGILIASAALTATLQQGRDVDVWLLAGVVLSLIAACLGVAAIFPRFIRYPDVMNARQEIYRRSAIADAEWWLADRLSEQYQDAAKHLGTRGALLRTGFVVLVASILATAGSVVAEFAGEVI